MIHLKTVGSCRIGALSPPRDQNLQYFLSMTVDPDRVSGRKVKAARKPDRFDRHKH